MARSLKTLGVDELMRVRRRVTRQHSLGRIYGEDRDKLLVMINNMETVIIEMEELDDELEEEL